MLAMATGIFVVTGESHALHAHDVAERYHADAEHFFWSLSSILDMLCLQQLSIYVASWQNFVAQPSQFFRHDEFLPKHEQNLHLPWQYQNTVLPEPFTLLSPHTDSSIRAMRQNLDSSV